MRKGTSVELWNNVGNKLGSGMGDGGWAGINLVQAEGGYLEPIID